MTIAPRSGSALITKYLLSKRGSSDCLRMSTVTQRMPKLTASSNCSTMADPVVDYYRCPEWFADFSQLGPLSEDSGFFRFGEDTCYGRCVGGTPAPTPTEHLYDCPAKIEMRDGLAHLPFHPFPPLATLLLSQSPPA